MRRSAIVLYLMLGAVLGALTIAGPKLKRYIAQFGTQIVVTTESPSKPSLISSAATLSEPVIPNVAMAVEAPKHIRATKVFKKAWEPEKPTVGIVAVVGQAVTDNNSMNPAEPVFTTIQSPKKLRNSHNIAVGFDAGPNFLLPLVRYQIEILERVVLGVQASYVTNIAGPKVAAAGVEFAATYYFEKAYRGFSLEAAVAYYDIEAQNDFRISRAFPIAYSLLFGWTSTVNPKLNLALNGGFRYVDNHGRAIGDIYFDGLLPMVKVTLGFDF